MFAHLQADVGEQVCEFNYVDEVVQHVHAFSLIWLTELARSWSSTAVYS